MYCRVCGSEENVHYRETKLSSLCDDCNSHTPKKVPRSEFDPFYWGKNNFKGVPDHIRKLHYEDYLLSNFSTTRYKKETTEVML